MRRVLFATGLVAACVTPVIAQSRSPFAGRWDIVVTAGNQSYPDWMELTEKDGAPQVRVQPRTGSVHPVKVVALEGDRLTLQLSAANAKRPETTWELTAAGGKISGSEKHGADATAQLAGVRAPELKRDAPKAWSNPEPLFNGKDLTGWVPDDASKNHWAAQEGILVNVEKGANLQTARKFQDFKLHIEFNCGKDANSGVYLRGRYETQIETESEAEPPSHHTGGVYGYLAPSPELPRSADVWQTFDITLIGRRVTIVQNGKTIIDNQEIPGITGGAINSHEALPAPIYLQGSEKGHVAFRSIVITPAK